MKSGCSTVFKSLLLCLIFGAASGPATLAQRDFSIQSEVLQETQEIVVYFPEGYDQENKEGYPVL